MFSNLCFYQLDCNVFVFFWNALACNKVICMYFIGSGGAIYVIFKIISTHFIVFSIVLYTFVRKYGLQFIFFLLSLSMVRGHKAPALWPMASPRNLFSEQHFSCIVQFMVWTILLRYFELYGHLGLWKNFLFCCRTWCLFSLLPLMHFAIGISMELMLFRGLLISSNIQNMLLNDSFESLCTIFGAYFCTLYL